MFSRGMLAAALCAASAAGAAMELAVPEAYPTIQAAVDAAPPGSIVVIQPGLYHESLVIKKDITLSGAESGEVVLSNTVKGGEIIKITAGAVAELQRLTLEHSDKEPEKKTPDYPDLILVDGARAHVRHCVLRNGAGCGIAVWKNSEARAEDCRMEGNVQTGILLRGEGARGEFTRNVITRNGWGGIMAFGGGTGVFTENTVSDNPHYGVLISGPTPRGAVIRGNVVERNQAVGIQIEQGVGTVVEGNTVRENVACGVWARCGTAASVRGNTVEKSGGPGIVVSDAGTDVKVEENACSQNKGDGILVRAGALAGVRRNTCRENTESGVSAEDWFTSADVSGNICEGNGGGGIVAALGASGSVAGNTCKGNGAGGIVVKDEGTEAAVGDNTQEGNTEASPPESVPLARQFPADTESLGWALVGGQYDYLERVADRLQQEKGRGLEGGWSLERFYEGVADGDWYRPTERPVSPTDLAEAWCRERPESGPARMLLAVTYKNLAWKLRGDGYANEVTEQGKEGLINNMRLAEKTLKEAESLSGECPELYTVWLSVGIGLSYPQERQREVFAKGIALAPDYFPLYRVMAHYLQPQWHGSKEELSAFFVEARTLAPETCGDALYAGLVACYKDVFDCSDYESGQVAEWDHLDAGFRQLLDDFPEASWYRNEYCLCACLFRQRESAVELFDRIGDSPNPHVWGEGDESTFEAYARWAREDGQPFPCVERTDTAGEQDSRKGFLRTWLVIITVPVALSILVSLGILAYFAVRSLRETGR